MTIPFLDIPSAVRILKKGGVIAYPTETVYGLGCDATRPEAVQRIFDLKGRDSQSPISVLIPSKEVLSDYVEEIPPIAETLIEKFWPGPLTLVFRAKPLFPSELLAEGHTIALRVSSHPVGLQLTQALGLPLTTTSANKSGQAPARSSKEVQAIFDQLDGMVDGGVLPPAKGSTIVDVTVDPPKIVREGEVLREDLMIFLRKVT
jgi:L-threonylcarbamoyladenylate synthase